MYICVNVIFNSDQLFFITIIEIVKIVLTLKLKQNLPYFILTQLDNKILFQVESKTPGKGLFSKVGCYYLHMPVFYQIFAI